MNILGSTLLNALVLLDDSSSSTVTGNGATGDIDIFQFMKNLANYIGDIGQWVIVLAGIVLLLIGAVQIVKGLASGGKGQVNWVMSIACLLVGGIMVAGGFTMIAKISSIGNATAKTMATSQYNSQYEVFKDGTAADNTTTNTTNPQN